MEKNKSSKQQQKEKATTQVTNKKKTGVLIAIIATILVIAILGMVAYARYRSKIGGQATAQVAAWSFKVNGNTESIASFDLGTTRNDANGKVANGLIAPGTSGSFDIEIDGSGSEVGIDYTIEIDTSNMPTNLKLYRDSNHTQKIEDESKKTTVQGYIELANIGTKVTETIYWDWPYRTGETDEEKLANDRIDTNEQGSSCILTIKVVGTQSDPNKKPVKKLADVVSVGDYVNYNAASGNGAGKSYTTDSATTGITDGAGTIFSSSDIMTWKVMSVDREAGTVELMAENPTANEVRLYGKTGYKNAEIILNNIGAVYGHGEGATGGRSITVEDVNKLENYTPTDDLRTSKTYTSGTFINDDGTETIATTDNPVTKSYTASTATKSTNKLYGYTTTNFSRKAFWLASCCLDLISSSHCDFYVRCVQSGGATNTYLYNSSGSEGVGFTAVLPVVTLKSNIQTSGQDESGAWNLKIE